MRKIAITLTAIGIHFIAFAQDLSYDKGVVKEIKNPYSIEDYFLLFPISELPAIGEDNTYLLNTSYRKKILALYQEAVKAYHPSDTTSDLLSSITTRSMKEKMYYYVTKLDQRNAFLAVSTLGDGEGYDMEFTYYKRVNQVPLIAVSLSYWSACCIASSLNFYVFENKKWKKVTSDFYPSIKLTDFIEDKKVLAKFSQKEIENPKLEIRLPQQGKKIKLSLDIFSYENKNISEADLHDRYRELDWVENKFGLVKLAH
jgi:hypothetical protein